MSEDTAGLMGEARQTEPQAGPKQAALSAVIFGLLLFAWAQAFLLQLGELAHNAESLGLTPLLGHTWAYYGSTWWIAAHWGFIGALAAYALWQRTGRFAAAVARVLCYSFAVAIVLLLPLVYCWYVDAYGYYLDDPHRAIHIMTLSALGTSFFGAVLYSRTRSPIAIWLAFLMPLCHMLAGPVFFGWRHLEDMDITAGAPWPYPTWPVVGSLIALVGVAAAVLAATSRARRVPPDHASVLLMTTAVALGVMHTVFLQIMMPFHLLIESICFTGFGWLRWISASCFVAEALIIYVIWRGRRSGVQRVGPAAPPSPQHPEPAP